jgi:Transposase DDE domain group 1
MTECIRSRLAMASEGKREVIAEFNGGTISSDGGALRLRETDRRLNLLRRFSQCFRDGRNPALIKHRIEGMLAQRVYGLAL